MTQEPPKTTAFAGLSNDSVTPSPRLADRIDWTADDIADDPTARAAARGLARIAPRDLLLEHMNVALTQSDQPPFFHSEIAHDIAAAVRTLDQPAHDIRRTVLEVVCGADLTAGAASFGFAMTAVAAIERAREGWESAGKPDIGNHFHALRSASFEAMQDWTAAAVIERDRADGINADPRGTLEERRARLTAPNTDHADDPEMKAAFEAMRAGAIEEFDEYHGLDRDNLPWSTDERAVTRHAMTGEDHQQREPDMKRGIDRPGGEVSAAWRGAGKAPVTPDTGSGTTSRDDGTAASQTGFSKADLAAAKQAATFSKAEAKANHSGPAPTFAPTRRKGLDFNL